MKYYTHSPVRRFRREQARTAETVRPSGVSRIQVREREFELGWFSLHGGSAGFDDAGALILACPCSHERHQLWRHYDEWAHHVAVFMFEDVAVVHESPREGFKAHENVDDFVCVDSNRVL